MSQESEKNPVNPSAPQPEASQRGRHSSSPDTQLSGHHLSGLHKLALGAIAVAGISGGAAFASYNAGRSAGIREKGGIPPTSTVRPNPFGTVLAGETATAAARKTQEPAPLETLIPKTATATETPTTIAHITVTPTPDASTDTSTPAASGGNSAHPADFPIDIRPYLPDSYLVSDPQSGFKFEVSNNWQETAHTMTTSPYGKPQYEFDFKSKQRSYGKYLPDGEYVTFSVRTIDFSGAVDKNPMDIAAGIVHDDANGQPVYGELLGQKSIMGKPLYGDYFFNPSATMRTLVNIGQIDKTTMVEFEMTAPTPNDNEFIDGNMKLFEIPKETFPTGKF